MNIERILNTNIPDIHNVYGGVRGRTLSSIHQEYAWPEIVDSGVHTIIDLREDGVVNKRMQLLCEQYGTHYFYYPVDKKGTLIDEMIDRFDELCNHIDQGGFYIACAMGLHRTDIALATYWVFHAADKCITPPTIYGYNQESGHTPDNIIRVLNAFYNRMTERNGVEPLSNEVFLRRKQTIKQLCRKKTKVVNNITKRIYVEMDGALVDTRSGYAKLDDVVKQEYAGRFNEIPNVTSLMDPTVGAIEAIRKIKEDGRFDLYIIATPQYNTPLTFSDKLRWVQDNLGARYQSLMIFTQHKELIHGDYLIDCSSKYGTKDFDGEWIHFGDTEFPDWNSVLNYLDIE